MVSKEILAIVKKFVNAIENKIKVEKVFIYGSYAKGTDNEYSDIDLAIISPDFGHDKFEENVFLRKVAWRIDERLEPVAFSPASFFEGDSNPLVHEIKNCSILIEIAA